MKIPHTPFLENIFALLKIVYQDIVEAFPKRKFPKANANFYVFESQCPKIMVLSKTLKAKLSLFPNGVANLLTLGIDRSEKSPSWGLRSTTRCGDAPACTRPVGGPSRLVGHIGSRGVLGALSLGGGRQVYLWKYGRNLGQILRDYQR